MPHAEEGGDGGLLAAMATVMAMVAEMGTGTETETRTRTRMRMRMAQGKRLDEAEAVRQAQMPAAEWR